MKLSKVLTPDKHSSAELRLAKFLRDLPDDEVLSGNEVGRNGRFSRTTVTLAAEFLDGAGLRFYDEKDCTAYHGNERVIAKVKASRGIK